MYLTLFSINNSENLIELQKMKIYMQIKQQK